MQIDCPYRRCKTVYETVVCEILCTGSSTIWVPEGSCAIDVGATHGRVNAEELVPHPTTVSRALPEMLREARLVGVSEVQTALQERCVAFTTDGWTDKYTCNHYITLTAHYIFHWNLQSRVMFTVRFPEGEPHTGKRIHDVLIDKATELGLDIDRLKQSPFVTD